jgi:uncharacterized protein
MTRSISDFTRRNSLPVFFGLAWFISWVLWLPLVLAALGHSTVPVVRHHHFLGALGPVAAACIVTAMTTGRKGVAALLSRLALRRGEMKWLLIAVLGPVMLFVVAALVNRCVNGVTVDIRQFGRVNEFPQLGVLSVLLCYMLTFGLGEEIGWRGFALPRLQARSSALTASLILSVGWAIWHLPAFWYRPGYSSMTAPGIAGWFFSLVTGAILLTWLFNSSGGNLLVVSAFHAAVDFVFTMKIVEGPMVSIMGALIVLWAIVIVVLARPANLSRSAKVTAPPWGESSKAAVERRLGATGA